jgi:hypothetical protein
MSDFYGCLLSTRFRVKDREKFLADPEVQILKNHAEKNDGFFDEENGYFLFGWSGSYPSVYIRPDDNEEEEEVEFDDGDVELDDGETKQEVGLDDKEHKEKEKVEVNITEVIEEHILPGDVCQIGISGNEKLWYIGGHVGWVSSKGTIEFNATIESDAILTEDDLHAQAERFLADIDLTFKQTQEQS